MFERDPKQILKTKMLTPNFDNPISFTYMIFHCILVVKAGLASLGLYFILDRVGDPVELEKVISAASTLPIIITFASAILLSVPIIIYFARVEINLGAESQHEDRGCSEELES